MEFPQLNKLVERYGSEGLVLVAINNEPESEATAKLIMEKQKYGFVNLQAPEKWVSKTFGVTAFPTTYVLDPNGKAVFIHKGFNAEAEETFAAEIEGLLARAK